MPLTGFTYSVDIASGTAVNPINDDLVFEERIDSDVNAYVRQLTTELVFRGDDYDLFYDYEASGACAELEFNISYNSNPFYTGILRIGSDRTSWDIDNCTFRATLDPSGDWQCFKADWEDEINILNNTTKRTVGTLLGSLVRETCGPVSNPVPIEIMGFFEQNVSGCLSGPVSAYSIERAYIEFSGGTYNHYAEWVSEQVVQDCSGGTPIPPPGDGWTLITDNCPTNATYGRAPQMEYVGELSDDTGKEWDNTYQVAGTTDANGVTIIEVDNGVLLTDILTGKKPACIDTVVSDFFGLNEDNTHPDNAAYDEAAANLQHVIVFQKSDVKRPNAENNARTGTWTFRDLLESLRAQFNVEWRVTGTTLRIEHVSYFERDQGTDLTTGANERFTRGLHEYSYDGTLVPKREIWQYMETVSQGFTGQPIYYSNCVSDDAEDAVIDMGRVNNDVSYIQANTDQVDDEGFVFVAAYFTTGKGYSYYFVSEESEFGGDTLLNGHMSIPNLQEHYHRWDRPLLAGRMNNVDTTFETAIPRKAQAEISIPMAPDSFAALDAYELINTQMGWGEVESFRYSARSCTLTLKLKH